MYGRFAASLGAGTIAMYLLSFSEIEAFEHFRPSLSNFYITLMMVAAMGLIMLTAMGRMLERRRLNLGLYAGFAALLVGAFLLGRTQALVGDDAFLGAMIPHHSRAILVCTEASLSDPAILELCEGIVRAQREEIAEMEAIIDRRG